MEIINSFLHANLQSQIFIISSILVLSVIQCFILLKLHRYLMVTFIVVLNALFALLLLRISHYNLRIHLLMYAFPSLVLAIIFFFLFKKSDRVPKKVKLSNPWGIYLEFVTKRGKKIINYNPFNGIFLVAGPGSGKTRWFIKPAILQFAKYNLPGIIYDYKRMDITRTAYTHYNKEKMNVRIVDFVEPSLSHKVNPLNPELLSSPAYANEFSEILFSNAQDGDAKNDPFFIPAAISVLSGVIWKLKEDYSEKCNLPYAVSICLNPDYKSIGRFIASNKQAALLGSTFLQVVNEPKTASAVMGSLSTVLRKFALPEVFYPLSGNDFSLDLNNKENPSLMCINNYKPLEKSLSPIISLIISVALKNINNPGKLPCCVVIDEGSTIKLTDYDNIPATGRENGIISFFVVQDKGQAIQKYGQLGSENIIRNSMMHIYGLCRSSTVAKEYSEMMGQQEKVYVSKTSGSHSTSSTTSMRFENVYRPQKFTELQTGEFLGLVAEGNVKKFHKHFQPYTLNDSVVDLGQMVSPSAVKKLFYDIIQDAENLLLGG